MNRINPTPRIIKKKTNKVKITRKYHPKSMYVYIATCNTHGATICNVDDRRCLSFCSTCAEDVDYGRRSSPKLITRIRIYRATYVRAPAPLVNEKHRRRPGAVILIHADARRGRFSPPTVLIILPRDIVRLPTLNRYTTLPWFLGTIYAEGVYRQARRSRISF